MKLWHLERDGDWQQTSGVVVAAEDEAQAREWAASAHGDEGEGPWYSEATCVEIGQAVEGMDAHVIMRDYAEV